MPITPAEAARLHITSRRKELQAELDDLAKLERVLAGRTQVGRQAARQPRPDPPKRQVSKETRLKLKAAMDRRWAAKRATLKK